MDQIPLIFKLIGDKFKPYYHNLFIALDFTINIHNVNTLCHARRNVTKKCRQSWHWQEEGECQDPHLALFWSRIISALSVKINVSEPQWLPLPGVVAVVVTYQGSHSQPVSGSRPQPLSPLSNRSLARARPLALEAAWHQRRPSHSRQSPQKRNS